MIEVLKINNKERKGGGKATESTRYIPYEERTGEESEVYFTRDLST